MDMEHKLKGNCEGCYYNSLQNTLTCIFPSLGYKLNTIEGCPCSTCIVKMVCNERCNSFMIFLRMFSISRDNTDWDKYYLEGGFIRSCWPNNL